MSILTSRLKAHLIFWKISMKSSPGGGLALMFNIPSLGGGAIEIINHIDLKYQLLNRLKCYRYVNVSNKQPNKSNFSSISIIFCLKIVSINDKF